MFVSIIKYSRKCSSLFAFLDVKLWLKEGDHQIVKYSLKFVHSVSESIDFF